MYDFRVHLSLQKPDEDEMLTKEEFIVLENRRLDHLASLEEDEELLDGHKNYIVRRWAVRIWNFRLESMIKDEAECFLNINWAGDRKECRVKTGEGESWWDSMSDKEVVWGVGTDPLCLRTDVLPIVEKGSILNFANNEFSFEWFGSYSDLQTQSMEIELWRYNKIRANTLDSVHRGSLSVYASGPVFQEVLLRKSVTGDELAVQADTQATATSRFKLSFQLYFQELYDFELNILDVQAFGLLSVEQLKKATLADLAQSTKQSGDTADRAAATYIFDPSEDESEEDDEEGNGSVKKLPSSTLRRRPVQRRGVMGPKKPALNKQTSQMKRLAKLKRRVHLSIANPTLGNSLRRGQMAVVSSLKKTDAGADGWGNIGKIHYRGTLADLDNDLLSLQIYESNTLVGEMLIAETAVSLRGVYEYGNVAGVCRLPKWLIEDKQSSSSAKQLIKSTVGRFEAKISTENLPKYKQTGDLCDMMNDKAYLLVRVIRVDRVAIPDQRPINQCDSAVQVQFNGNSYETEVRQDTIAPQFDQEFYFELKTNSPADFSPEELALMHGPIILDVWLRSDDEGALSAEHCGHVEVNLSEIFSQGKPETKLHNSIRTGEITEYRTQVLKARKRLTCLWTAVGNTNTAAISNVPATALLPSFLYVDVWLRPFDFSAFNIQGVKATSVSEPSSGASLRKSVTNLVDDSIAIPGINVLPPRVRVEWQSRFSTWASKCVTQRERFPGILNRQYECTAKSQNREEHFLPLFLDVIRPPQVLSNPKAIAFWIHCLSHTTLVDLKAAFRFWSTPDFTLSLGKGDTFAHALLHASILRGLPGSSIRPFVCVGTGWDGEPMAWVTILKPNGSVTVYDTATHRSFELPNRCADIGRCARVVANKRPPGQQVSSELQEMEIRRRQRLVLQEVSMKTMGVKAEPSTFGCDATIFRSPELLKLFDLSVHTHALALVSNIDVNAQCFRCGLPPDKAVLWGYVCNRKLAGEFDHQMVCDSSDSGDFLCVRCAASSYPNELPIAQDSEGGYIIHDFQPMKFSTQPTLPYKTIEVVFDATNCWMNLQHFCPGCIYYDFWNPVYWHPFTTCITSFRSFSMASNGLRKAKSKEYFNNIRFRIEAKVKKSIQSLRRNGNLSTYYQRDELLIEHMELGLELQFRLSLVDERASIEAEFTEWRMLLYAKTPHKHKFIGYTFQFSFYDSIEIARIITEQIPFTIYKEDGTQFVIATYIGKLPNSVTACYVSIAIVCPLSELAVEEILANRTDALLDNNPFNDETVEQNRLFTLRTQVYQTDMEFIAAMRTDLYKDKERGGVVKSVITNSSKAPTNEFVKSIVDYIDKDARDLPGDTPRETPGNASPLPADDDGGMFGSFFNNLMSGSPVEPSEPISMKPPPIVRPPKDLYQKKFPVITPLSLVNPINPTSEDLKRIYQPERFDKITGQQQYLRNLVTGTKVLIPPQTPLQYAASLGVDNVVGKVRVNVGKAKRRITNVAPSKDAVISFNRRINSFFENPQ